MQLPKVIKEKPHRVLKIESTMTIRTHMLIGYSSRRPAAEAAQLEAGPGGSDEKKADVCRSMHRDALHTYFQSKM